MSMYRESFALALRLHTTILLAMVLDIALQVLVEKDILGDKAGISVTIIWSLPAFFAHLHILFPEKAERDFNVIKISGFFLRNLGLIILSMLPGVLVAISMLQAIQAEVGGDEDQMYILTTFFLIIPTAITFLLVFGVLGTLLPAYVTGRERGIGKALSRAKESFFPIIGRTIIGPAPILLLSLFLVGFLPVSLNVPLVYLTDNWIINTPFFLIMFAALLLQGWAIVMMAWILSKAFLATEGKQKGKWQEAN